jgi:hypothetical protein
LEYWTNKKLSYVSSALGVSLHVDATILMRKWLTYARVYVEIDASKLLVKEFDPQCSNRMVITILAEYESPSTHLACLLFNLPCPFKCFNDS